MLLSAFAKTAVDNASNFQVGPLPSTLTAFFLMATSAGAQCFKVPVAYLVDSDPTVVVHFVSVGAGACVALFGTSFAISAACRQQEQKG